MSAKPTAFKRSARVWAALLAAALIAMAVSLRPAQLKLAPAIVSAHVAVIVGAPDWAPSWWPDALQGYTAGQVDMSAAKHELWSWWVRAAAWWTLISVLVGCFLTWIFVRRRKPLLEVSRGARLISANDARKLINGKRW